MLVFLLVSIFLFSFINSSNEAIDIKAEVKIKYTKMRLYYNKEWGYDKEWGNWEKSKNTLIFNYKNTGNIRRIRADKKKVIYRPISQPKEEYHQEHGRYITFYMLDEKNKKFFLQAFDNQRIGVIITYEDGSVKYQMAN